MPQPYDPSIFNGPQVANDYTDGIEEPDWAPFTADGAMTFDQDRHGNAGVLTIHGLIDTLHRIEEEGGEFVKRFLEGEVPEHELPEWLRRALPSDLPPPVDVRAAVEPARHFRTTSFLLPAGGEPTLISAMSTRRRLTVTNTGSAPAAPILASGRVTNPGANAVIASTGNLLVGKWYTATITVYIDGGATADDDNMKITGPGQGMIMAVPGTVVSPTTRTFSFQGIGGALGVSSVAAASGVTAIYHAEISVTTVPGVTDSAQLSWTDAATGVNTAGDMEWITVNAGADGSNPRMIQAYGKVYAYSTNGTTLDVLEEYGVPERRGVYNGPAGG